MGCVRTQAALPGIYGLEKLPHKYPAWKRKLHDFVQTQEKLGIIRFRHTLFDHSSRRCLRISAFSRSCLSPERHAPADGQIVNLGIIFRIFSPCMLRLGNGWYGGMGKSLRRVLCAFGSEYLTQKTVLTQLARHALNDPHYK